MIDWTLKRQRCPSCGRDGEHGMRGTLGVGMVDKPGPLHGKVAAHCFRCSYVELQGCMPSGRTMAPAQAARQAVRHETLADFGRKLWASCRPIGGDALAYLQARHCALPPEGTHLRYHPALRHSPSGTTPPALVALVTDALTLAPLTLHRTWICADGNKAPVDPPRMLLGGHSKAGGVVRLWPDDSVTTGLAITEGLETALSIAHGYTPVWACLDAGNLSQFPVLPGVESLLIAADHDDAGLQASQACARRWAAAGREVRIVTAPTWKADINDLARAA